MFVPNMAPFLCLRDSCCCSAMTRSSPPCAASLGEQEKPDMTSWILAGRANAAKPRREMRKTMATSSPISVLFAVQKSTKLRTSKSGKVWAWDREGEGEGERGSLSSLEFTHDWAMKPKGETFACRCCAELDELLLVLKNYTDKHCTWDCTFLTES